MYVIPIYISSSIIDSSFSCLPLCFHIHLFFPITHFLPKSCHSLTHIFHPPPHVIFLLDFHNLCTHTSVLAFPPTLFHYFPNFHCFFPPPLALSTTPTSAPTPFPYSALSPPPLPSLLPSATLPHAPSLPGGVNVTSSLTQLNPTMRYGSPTLPSPPFSSPAPMSS